ncbi:undecaprenyldiphospho-muramoylpentapeptide beta-N-acetylglucosaminyltransferase [Pseudidiomarina aestuarii]|uniref:UDP-N-acetylglucosamine--N-acetylmuramyl-(pentapeptide) pyrophosphoryl-undecaprenol N-acetylglucosamine transferase n=1 Tax=Pseudidiomarina aestuarii TaxID=624146 RepID=A0A7Z6ZUT6_9GAMM|nr:undecaprenyldiphospho-muramoylpentapeptide beta-N-acetylglucosaminyltransferase [Pseudidiomarina aestuarii]RUO41773.1 undecaprenyldiphospho-muramoylpentapeptide beta-N-acetylglucosaminyltransferase [Pseudidiomarina aestuarii]
MNRVLIAAAGTGGHVFPALAVAEKLRSYGWQVLWLGTAEGRLESKVVPNAGFQLETVGMQGLRGHGLMRKLSMPWQLLRAAWQCRQLLRRERIQLVVTFGGYVCGPAGLAARWCGIPVLVHEQNAVAGMTNKFLARFASHVMVGFAAARKQLPRADVTGNPLREQVLENARQQRAQSTTERVGVAALVIGGSLGATALNEALPRVFAELQKQLGDQPIQVVHQCGAGRQTEVEQLYAEQAFTRVTVVDFIDDMASAYAAADVVICRAGALTVAELALLGKPAVLIPLPHAVDDHQTANAMELVRADAGILLPQTTLGKTSTAVQRLAPLFADAELRRSMQKNAAAVAYPKATDAVVNQCERWANPEAIKAGRV